MTNESIVKLSIIVVYLVSVATILYLMYKEELKEFKKECLKFTSNGEFLAAMFIALLPLFNSLVIILYVLISLSEKFSCTYDNYYIYRHLFRKQIKEREARFHERKTL